MGVAQLALVALVATLAGCAVLVLTLAGIRLIRERDDRRRVRLRGPTWSRIMELVTTEGAEADELMHALERVPRGARDAVVDDAFALVPKLRGAARERLRQVLRSWGLLEESRELAVSRSAVRRCRGVHRLGVLADPSAKDLLVGALGDRDFAVRRTALHAVASLADADVVRPALDTAVAEPRLRRDFLASVNRIGRPAVEVLQAELTTALAAGLEGERRGYLCAEGLGLTGALMAVPVLVGALDEAEPLLQVACLEALGDLGAPSSVVAVAPHLTDSAVEVRRASAGALGRIGAPAAVADLEPALADPDVEVARAAAGSLLRCGPRGRDVLEASDSPLARETLALSRLRSAG
jgi:HEAT repeat protein